MSDADYHRTIIESCPEALSCHTASGAFLLASPAWARLLGCAVEALIGRTLEEIALPEDAAAVARSCEEAPRTMESTTIRYRALHQDSRTIWVESTLRAVPGDEAGAARLVGSSRDVTATILTEQETKVRLERAELAEEHRDNLVGMIPGLVWYGPISPDLTRYHVTYMSDYLVRVTGYSPQEWFNTPGIWRSIIHPADREQVIASAAMILPDGEAFPAYRVFAKNGRTIWLQSYMSIQRDAAGVPLRRHGFTLDVTTFKETEIKIEELLQQQTFLTKRIDEIISSVPGIVWETWPFEDERGPVSMRRRRANFCSDYVETLTGYTAEEWSSQPNAWIKLMPQEDREKAREKVARLIASGGGSFQHRLLTKDQREIWLDNHMVVGRDAGGLTTWTRGVALDITERKRAEQERERLQKQVEIQAERLLELSTPLIPVSDRILVMPLVGTIDGVRADQIMTSLLKGLSASRVQVVIIDVTGVPALDASNAGSLLLAAKAAQLLGARVILTGIRPEVARTLTGLDLDLSGVVTRRTLATAFAELTGSGMAQGGSSRRPALAASRR